MTLLLFAQHSDCIVCATACDFVICYTTDWQANVCSLNIFKPLGQ